MRYDLIKTITANLGTSLEPQSIYTVPVNSRFICFKKMAHVISGSSNPPSGYVTITDGSWKNSVVNVGEEELVKEIFEAGETITAQQSVVGNMVVLEGILIGEYECPVEETNPSNYKWFTQQPLLAVDFPSVEKSGSSVTVNGRYDYDRNSNAYIQKTANPAADDENVTEPANAYLSMLGGVSKSRGTTYYMLGDNDNKSTEWFYQLHSNLFYYEEFNHVDCWKYEDLYENKYTVPSRIESVPGPIPIPDDSSSSGSSDSPIPPIPDESSSSGSPIPDESSSSGSPIPDDSSSSGSPIPDDSSSSGSPIPPDESSSSESSGSGSGGIVYPSPLRIVDPDYSTATQPNGLILHNQVIYHQESETYWAPTHEHGIETYEHRWNNYNCSLGDLIGYEDPEKYDWYRVILLFYAPDEHKWVLNSFYWFIEPVEADRQMQSDYVTVQRTWAKSEAITMTNGVPSKMPTEVQWYVEHTDNDGYGTGVYDVLNEHMYLEEYHESIDS